MNPSNFWVGEHMTTHLGRTCTHPPVHGSVQTAQPRTRTLYGRRREGRLLLLVALLHILYALCMFTDTIALAQENVAADAPPVAIVKSGGLGESARWLLDSEIGTYAGLGYKLPHTAFGVSMEKPVSRRLELQADTRYSPDRKLITNDGQGLVVSARAIFWANHYFGLTGGTDYSRLWTSQFNKAARHPSPGVVFRLRFLGSPTRMYLDYVVPNGTIDARGIESSRIQGPEYYVESRMASMGPVTMRFGLKWDVYHFLDQGDPLCDGTFGGSVTCRRTGYTTGTAALTLRFEWVKNVSNTLY